LQLAIPITGALLNSPRVLEAHETIVPWQLWHYIYIFFKCQKCQKNSFSQREILNNIFEKNYILEWNRENEFDYSTNMCRSRQGTI
jgi:hypothetical protein